MDVILILFFVTVITWLIQIRWSKRHLYNAVAKMNSPPVFPIIGHAYIGFGKPEDILSRIMKVLEKYPAPIRIWLGSQLYVGITKTEHLEIVLNHRNCLEKGDLYKFIMPWLGFGLLTAPVKIWKRHRKIILPTFNQKTLNAFIEEFEEQSKILIKKLDSQVGKGEFNIFQFISPCTLDIICGTAMGVNVNAQNGNSKYVRCAMRALEIMCIRFFKIWYHFDFVFNCTKLAKEEKKCLSYLHNFASEVIESKQNDFLKKTQEIADNKKMHNSEEATQPQTKRKAFLDLLIELSDEGLKLTNEELRHEVDTLMIGGNDTTASVNSFTLMMLGMHKDIQDEMYKELYSIFGSSDRNITAEDLSQMQYTEMVIKETMRLFPIGPFIIRTLTGDIDIGDFTLPAGSGCIIPIIYIHRNPDVWTNPLIFDPKRFTKVEIDKRHRYSYIPFSAGPRSCIGFRYAMKAMKTVISSIVRKYKIHCSYKSPADIKLKMDIILRPVDGHRVSIERR